MYESIKQHRTMMTLNTKVFSTALSHGCQMVFSSEVQSHLDVGDHSNAEEPGKFTVYDKLRRDWRSKFQSVDTRASGHDARSNTRLDPQFRVRSRQKHINALHCDLHI